MLPASNSGVKLQRLCDDIHELVPHDLYRTAPRSMREWERERGREREGNACLTTEGMQLSMKALPDCVCEELLLEGMQGM